MGISNFFSYVSNIKGLKNWHQLHNTSVVIDGSNVFFLLYQDYNSTKHGRDFKFGGNYDGYRKYCQHFFDQLNKCQIKPLVVMDGTNKYSSSDFDKRIDNLKKLHRYDSLRPLLLEEIFVSVLTELNLDYLRTIHDSDPDLAKLANQLQSSVISSDSDFYCFNVEEGVISFNDLQWTQMKKLGEDPNENDFYIDCQIFKFQDFADRFPGLTTKMMPVFASLFSNDFVHLNTVFDDFLKSIVDGSSEKRMVNGWNNNKYKRFNKSLQRMERIDRFLKWLSHLNGDPDFAINRLKSYIDRREVNDEEKEELVTSLNNALASYECNEDNETYLKKILELKQKKIEGDDQSLKQTLIDFNVLDKDCQRLPNYVLDEFFVRDNITLWAFRLTNPSLTVELKQLVEDLTLDSVYESCIDLIKIFSGLLRADDQVEPIKVHFRKESKLSSEEVLPAIEYTSKSDRKPLPNISELADLSPDAREELFVDLVEVNVHELALGDLSKEDYDFWRYLVINIKYWMNKTQMENKHSLVNVLVVSAIYHKFEDNIQCEEIKNLAEEMPTENDFDIKNTHYYNQFQAIYRFIDCLHSLLGYPIGRAQLASSMNGVLISRIVRRSEPISFDSEKLNELKNNLIRLIDNQ